MKFILEYLTFICLIIILLNNPAYANNDIIWQHDQYITKEIDGGKFIATINFTEDGKFKGTVKGTDNLESCEARFWGKGTPASNPLYSRFTRAIFFSNIVNEWIDINTSYMAFEKRGKTFLMTKKNIWFYCSDLNYNTLENKKNIPAIIKFYPKK